MERDIKLNYRKINRAPNHLFSFPKLSMQNQETTWKITARTSEAWEEMLDSLSEAKVSIDLENFIVCDFCSGQIGYRLLEILKAKARDNVRVRLLVDAVGSFDFLTSDKQTELEEVGIEVKVFKTLPTKRIYDFLGLFLRDHRKLLIIDGKEAFIGGVCFQGCQVDWRDLNIKLSGEIVNNLQVAFDNMFVSLGKVKLKQISKTRDNFAVLSGAPRNRQIYHEMLRAVRQAKLNIIILTPYFAPPTKLLIALARASRRGVKITFLFSKQTDNAVGDLVLRSYIFFLLKRSMKVFFCIDTVNHGKAMVVDDRWVTVGSANFDRLSLLYNNELNIMSENKMFVDDLAQVLNEVKTSSEEINLNEWKRRDWKERIFEILVRPLRLIA